MRDAGPEPEPREKTELENRVESVPETGVLPSDTDISLEDDL
jgi:hypothetical protein